jgi:hypothetical protein
MNNVIKLTLAMVLMNFMLASCSKKDENIKDEDSGAGNYFKLDNAEYKLSAGLLDNYGTDDSLEWHYGYAQYLLLYSNGFTLSVDTDHSDIVDWDIIGKGNALVIDLYSSTGSMLDNGEYSYSNAIPSPIGTFDFASCLTDFDAAIDDESQENKIFEIVSGKLSVSRTDNTYTITINGTTADGKTITGYYKGSLRYFDFSGYDKKSTSLPGFYPKGANRLLRV